MVALFEKWFGDQGTMTPAARLLILLFACVGLVTAPVMTWFSKSAYDEFKRQTERLAHIEGFLGVAAERARNRDERVDRLERSNDNQQGKIDDHERRLIRIETQRGVP